MTPAQCLEYAQDMVESTQGTKRLNNLGTWFTTDTSKKVLTFLYNYSAGSYQLARMEASNAKAKGELEGFFGKEFMATAVGASLAAFLCQVAGPALMNMLVRLPEDEWDPEHLQEQSVLQLFSMVPALSHWLGTQVNRTVKGEDFELNLPAVYEPGQFIWEQINQWINGRESGKFATDNPEEWEKFKALTTIASVVSSRVNATGIGTPALYRFLENAYDFDEASVHNILALFFSEKSLS
jgi:hypothetical protein